jgi:hypothetical protein
MAVPADRPIGGPIVMKRTRWHLGLVGAAAVGIAQAQETQPAIRAEWVEAGLRVQWPIEAVGYSLQEADRLDGEWRSLGLQPDQVGALFELTIPCAESIRFYRLRHPGDPDPWPTPELMGLVLDPTGAPVVNATVQGSQPSDENGVFAGNLSPSAAGYIRVDTPDFVSAFAQPQALAGRAAVVQVWLSPYPAMARLDTTSSTAALVIGTPERGFELTVSGEALDRPPAYVGLAELDPLSLDPLFARLDPELEGVYLHRAFAVQAFDNLHDELQLAEHQALTLMVQDASGFADPPELAWFDPETGRWLRLPGACQRLDENRYTCALPRLWPLYGLFVPGDPPYGLTRAITPQGRKELSRPVGLQDESEFGSAYNDLLAKLRDRLRQIEDDPSQGGQEDPIIRDLLEQMAQLARDYANANRDESGKFFLVVVAGRAGLLAQTDLQDSLMRQATELTNEIASRLLAEGDCGRIRQMLNAMAQVVLFDGDPAIEEALRAKIDFLLAECDLWIGWIRCFFTLDSDKSLSPDDPPYRRGGGATHWLEKHEVQMATHAQTHVLTGELRSKISFPRVRYVERDEACPHFHEFYGTPSENLVSLYFGGTYDGRVFDLQDVYLSEDANPVELWMYHISRSIDGDGVCVENAYTSYPWPIPYYSAIMHGFEGPWQSPSLSLQEMTESEIHNGSGEGETIRGWERIVNASGYTHYPFTTGDVSWTFIRVQAILPL